MDLISQIYIPPFLSIYRTQQSATSIFLNLNACISLIIKTNNRPIIFLNRLTDLTSTPQFPTPNSLLHFIIVCISLSFSDSQFTTHDRLLYFSTSRVSQSIAPDHQYITTQPDQLTFLIYLTSNKTSLY